MLGGGVTVQPVQACAQVEWDPFQVQVSPRTWSLLTWVPVLPLMPPNSTAPLTEEFVADATAAKSLGVRPAGAAAFLAQVQAPVLVLTVRVQVSLSRSRQLASQVEVASSPPNSTSVL